MAVPDVETRSPAEIGTNYAVLRGYCWTPGTLPSYIAFEWRQGTLSSNHDLNNWTPWFAVLISNTPLCRYEKITGLSAGQSYQYRIVGAYSGSYNYATPTSFTTKASSPPTVGGYVWVEGDKLCYTDSQGYKKQLLGG